MQGSPKLPNPVTLRIAKGSVQILSKIIWRVSYESAFKLSLPMWLEPIHLPWLRNLDPLVADLIKFLD